MKELTLNVQSNDCDENTLHYYSWIPERPKGWIHIIHGMSEHARRYEEVATFFNNAGYMVTADDHRGHGQTGASSGSIAHLADQGGWQRLLQDQMELLRNISRTNRLKPFILGHSMGAAMSLALCQNYAHELRTLVAGIILSGSWYACSASYLSASAIAHLERACLGPRNPSKMLHYLSFGNFNRSFKPYKTEADWLSRDKSKVLEYVADPLCGFPLTTQSWVDFINGLIQMFQRKSFVKIHPKIPFYLISGDRDPVGANGKKVQELFCRLTESGVEDVKITLHRGCRHEILNEINRRDVCLDVHKWMDSVLSRK